MKDKAGVLLVLYYTRGVFPLRAAISDHLFCWKKYSKHRTVYINVAFGFPWWLLRNLTVRTVLFHTIFLSMRWSLDTFRTRTRPVRKLSDWNCAKIALPQDEFFHTEVLSRFLGDVGVTHVYSCAERDEWAKIYPNLDQGKVHFGNVLTGYLDENTINCVAKLKQKKFSRDIDIGYRAWKAAYWLGEHARHKVRVGDVIEQEAQRRGLKSDISFSDDDVFLGLDWFRFLLRCKATIGVEGGASVLDMDGSIKARVEAYLQDHPDASFEETRDACFADDDKSLHLACISPRHLEACLTETCQILVEGKYSGVLEPDVHYISLKKDYSNLTEVFEKLADEKTVSKITRRAYLDVIGAGRWTYRQFVRSIEEEAIDCARMRSGGVPWLGALSFWALGHWERLCWVFIRIECRALEDIRRDKAHSFLAATYRIVYGLALRLRAKARQT